MRVRELVDRAELRVLRVRDGQEAVDVRWTDKEWTASVNMPVDGRDVSGANVHISREVKF